MAACAVGVDGFPGGGPPPVIDMKALSLAMVVCLCRHTRACGGGGRVEEKEKKARAKRR
jgi:hypothetical protein